VLAQRFQCVDHLCHLRRRLDVDVEDVLPGTTGSRPGLELRQVEVPLCERAEAAIERAGDVADAEDERGLVRLAERRRVSRQGAEARGVVGICLDPVGERREAVELAGAA
jgi:hypothetical protein